MDARLLVLIAAISAPALTSAQQSPEAAAEIIQKQMQRRGSPASEIHLALAAVYARAKRGRELSFHLGEARKLGISASRTDLLLGSYYRGVARYDAAFSTLVRVLVRHGEQPYALVALWKTLYECKLQGATVKTEIETIRERLSSSGLHFPREFKLTPKSQAQAKKLTSAGYNALLASKASFAAELFQSAIDAFPSEAQAHRGLGIARARLEDYTRAAGAYLLYLELAPSAPDADEVDRILMDYWRSRCSDC
jgi:tetratricopeptide (TPR) repeat protein